MTDSSTKIHSLKEQLREAYADVCLVALKQQAGLFLTSDQYYKVKEKLMDAISEMAP